MTTETTIVQGYAKPGTVPPEFQVEYIYLGSFPYIISVHTAMGERLPAEHHPRFRYWLIAHLYGQACTQRSAERIAEYLHAS